MAVYNCTLYLRTGFNSINIPDSPSLLSNFGSVSPDSLDINQERFLSEIRVRASWDDIKDADYAKIGDFYYFINHIFMSSRDGAELQLSPDFLTSGIARVGGISNLNIIDGTTERVHVSDDTYGLYGSNDPYMAPAYDMDVLVDTSSGNLKGTSSYTFIETTLQMTGTNGMGSWYHPNDGETAYENLVDKYAITCFSDAAHAFPITFPVASYIGSSTKTNYYVDGSVASMLPTTPGQVLYWTNDTSHPGVVDQVNRGVVVARALGIEESISGSFEIPSSMIEQPNTPSGNVAVLSLTGKTTSKDTNIPYKYFTGAYNAKNNRVYYGSQTPYTLTSAAGNSVTVNAEEIYDSLKTAPEVIGKCDPRREGCPYYRFKWMNGVSGVADAIDFFRNAVAGTKWRSVPMVFTQKSGNLLDRLSFEAQKTSEDLNKKWQEKNAVVGTIGGIVNMAAGLTMGVMKADPNAIMGGVSAGVGVIQGANNYTAYLENMKLARGIEEQQFGISQNVNVPTINFPLNPDLISDLTGNGFLLSRVVYKVADIQRIDKILTAYGYQHTKVLETSDFTNRQKFNYVRGSISVGGLPRWWADGISAQISGGVRVWHVVPDPSYYTSGNPIA